MPIYEYECDKCGAIYELLTSINTEDKEVICPKCGAKKKAKKLISAFGSISGSSGGASCGSSSSSSGFT